MGDAAPAMTADPTVGRPKMRKNLLGDRFGHWSVIADAGRGPKGNALWLCRCDCGTEKAVASQGLIAGDSKSCGCGRLESRMATDVARRARTGNRGTGFSLVVSQYRICAARRGLTWALSDDTVAELTKRNCNYCNGMPAQVRSPKRTPWVYNGIDRVDNSLGYIDGNVVTCCSTCNYMKRRMGVEAFIAHITAIYEYSVRAQYPTQMRAA